MRRYSICSKCVPSCLAHCSYAMDNTRLQYCNRAHSSISVRCWGTWTRYANPPSSLNIRRTDLSLTPSFSDFLRRLRFEDCNTCRRSRPWFSFVVTVLGRPIVPFRWHKTDPLPRNFSTIARIVLLLGAVLLNCSNMAQARSILTPNSVWPEIMLDDKNLLLCFENHNLSTTNPTFIRSMPNYYTE